MTKAGRVRVALVDDHPFRDALAGDILQLCHHPDAGRLILAGWVRGREPISLASENGAHGGLGPEETHAFAILPSGVPAPFRPLDLRKAVQTALGRHSRPEPAVESEGSP